MGVDILYFFDHDMIDMTTTERAAEIIKRFKEASRDLFWVDKFDNKNFNDYMMHVSPEYDEIGIRRLYNDSSLSG